MYDLVSLPAAEFSAVNQFFRHDLNSFPVVPQNILGADFHPFEKGFGFILSYEMAKIIQYLSVISVSVKASTSARIEDPLSAQSSQQSQNSLLCGARYSRRRVSIDSFHAQLLRKVDAPLVALQLVGNDSHSLDAVAKHVGHHRVSRFVIGRSLR